MTLGVIILAHADFPRVAENVRIWARAGCPVVLHVDSAVAASEVARLKAEVQDVPQLHFSRRHRSEWGTWGIVAATLAAAEEMLARYPDLGHVYLASGACLPLRDVSELRGYLAASPQTDFIESVTTDEVVWPVGGLDRDRFLLRFPFSWKRQRRLFDRYVRLQRALGLRRRVPETLTPHLGSQWWCLTARTLRAILDDPRRGRIDSFFRHVWIPDESYFQSLARDHSRQLESRSLTLSKFDYHGKPHHFYDDHLVLLQRSNCFVARKIWPGAHALHESFPMPPRPDGALIEPNSSTVDRVFAQAAVQRTRGRPGLHSQSRFPTRDHERRPTARAYSVLHGFEPVFDGFEGWLRAEAGQDAVVHGHLFARARAEFPDREPVYRGGLSAERRLRDYAPADFLRNLVWNDRDRHQAFLFRPDDRQEIARTLATDPNAHLTVVTGSWAVALFTSGRAAADVRKTAARLQRIEHHFVSLLRSPQAQAQVRIFTLAEFLETPTAILSEALATLRDAPDYDCTALPPMPDLSTFPTFVRDLKNQGMHPFLAGDFDGLAARAAQRRLRAVAGGAQ